MVFQRFKLRSSSAGFAGMIYRSGAEFVIAGFTVDVGLPVVAGLDMEAGEPAAAADVGIDVDGVSEVQGEVGSFLGSVATDHDLSGLVGKRRAEFLVNQGERMLLRNGNVVLKVGMHKDVGLGLVVGLGVADELPVGFGDGVHASIGFQGLPAAPRLKPMGEVGVIDPGKEKLLLVVSVQEGGSVFFLDADEELDDSFGIWAAIDVVSDENEMVFRGGGDDLDHLSERVEASVNVADGKCSHKSAVRVSVSGPRS